jgi:hypothetical protein
MTVSIGSPLAASRITVSHKPLGVGRPGGGAAVRSTKCPCMVITSTAMSASSSPDITPFVTKLTARPYVDLTLTTLVGRPPASRRLAIPATFRICVGVSAGGARRARPPPAPTHNSPATPTPIAATTTATVTDRRPFVRGFINACGSYLHELNEYTALVGACVYKIFVCGPLATSASSASDEPMPGSHFPSSRGRCNTSPR